MKTANDPRHILRVKAMQELFAWHFSKNQSAKKLDNRISPIFQHLDKIDPLIQKAAPERPLKQINPIDLAVLRQAVYELVIESKTPPKVVIDEAVELGKEFGSDASPSFINGVLGKIISDNQIIAP